MNGFDVKVDAVEGNKNFEKAYDKRVQKYYKEEGASLLIPKEEKKELEECSFAPKINRIGGQKKKTNKNGSNYQ